MDASQINLWLNIVTVLIGGGCLGVILRHRQVIRGLANADIADIRDHYAAEVKRYAEEVQRVTARQLECEERERSLRHRITELEDAIRGLKDQLRTQSADRVIALEERGDRPSEAVLRAAHSVKRITGEEK